MHLDLSQFDAAIVDLDGTMVDTLGDFAVALNLMLADLALPPIEARHVEAMVGKGSEHLIVSVLNHVAPPRSGSAQVAQSDAIYQRARQKSEHRQRDVQRTQGPAWFDDGLKRRRTLGYFFENLLGPLFKKQGRC